MQPLVTFLNLEELEMSIEEKRDTDERILELLPQERIWTAKLVAVALKAKESTIRNRLKVLAERGAICLQANTKSGRNAHNKDYLYRAVGTAEVNIVPHDLGVTGNYVGL